MHVGTNATSALSNVAFISSHLSLPVWRLLQFSPERERYGTDKKQERDSVIPFDTFTEVHPREDDEHAKGDHFLDDFQLKRSEFAIADAVRGDLKAVFGERDEPAYDDCCENRRLAIFQMTVPGDGHEDVRTNQKKNGFHNARIVARTQSWRPPCPGYFGTPP